MKYVFEPAPTPGVAVFGEDAKFPVRRIFCVGRNYAAHAREMGKDPDREPPFFFTKPADAVVNAAVEDQALIPYPPETANLHHEIELTIAIGKPGRNIRKENSLEHVFGYATGIDLTRRDLQSAAKAKGQPWDWGKAFDKSAPMAPIHRAESVGHLPKGRIWLRVGDAVRQDANLSELIWPVPDIISIVSHSIELRSGDLIMTGTPAGVGPILPGEHVRGGIDGLSDVAITIAPPSA